MDPLTPLRFGVGLTQTLAGGAIRVATAAPRLVFTLVRSGPVAAAEEVRDTVEDGVTDAAPNAQAAREAAVRDAQDLAVRRPAESASDAAGRNGDVPAARPEPTSAAGASGGVGGTLDAEGDAGRAGAPDPTGENPVIPQGERRTSDVAPPSRFKTEDDTDAVVHSFGDPDEPAGPLVVNEPWPGYAQMKVADVVDRLQGADEATRAVVLLYEQGHKKRKRVLEAAGATG
jgi:hypothetical protein